MKLEISMSEEPLTKRHYYAISFIAGSENGLLKIMSVYMGYPDQKVTLKRIASARRSEPKMPESAPVVSVSYLGYMTDDEMDFME